MNILFRNTLLMKTLPVNALIKKTLPANTFLMKTPYLRAPISGISKRNKLLRLDGSSKMTVSVRGKAL